MTMEQDTGNEKLEIKKRHPFSGWPMAIFFAGMLVFAAHACTHMVAAGDTWVAMACGRHHSNHGVNTVEPFSANSHDAGPTEASIKKWPDWAQGIAGHFDIETIRKWHPTGWVNQNWLTHTTFYRLAKFFGTGDDEYNYNGLVYWKFAIFIFEAFCIYFFARLIGVSVPGSATASAMALFIGRSFLDIRPACYANVLAAALLLVMALSIYKNYRYIWLIVAITVFWSNVHGGYIYVYMMMVPFVALNLLAVPFKDKFHTVGLKGVYHAIGAGFASFFAMVLFNPYKLTNLTHTFEVSVSKHAESWRSVNEWHPAFEWSNPVGSAKAFLVMFIISWVALILWSAARFLKPRIETRRRARQQAEGAKIQWPKIDPAIIAIAVLSVYMAVSMRRFIPIAASVACPVIALFLEQTVQMFLARKNYNKTGELKVPALPCVFYTSVITIAAIITLSFGLFWGAKFKRIYLDPWPTDEIRDSVFMRMTASNVKPFDVTQFMRENELSGNMFNYWTEGGAIAFGQEPDAETGRTPLQLFMDGRAQAAYDHSNFLLWRYLYSGGKAANDLRRANQNRLKKREPTSDELKAVSNYLTEEMKKRDIWVFVLPVSQFKPTDKLGLPIRLSSHPDWVPVYTDNYQQMYVNKTMEKGRDLFGKIMEKKAKFPTEFSENLTLGRLYLRTANPRLATEGFDRAVKALELDASRGAMALIAYEATRRPNFRKKAIECMENYVADFTKNKNSLSNEGGYAKRLEAAVVAVDYLGRILYKKSDPELSKKYLSMYVEYWGERSGIGRDYKW